MKMNRSNFIFFNLPHLTETLLRNPFKNNHDIMPALRDAGK